jgi:hypothetical protein
MSCYEITHSWFFFLFTLVYKYLSPYLWRRISKFLAESVIILMIIKLWKWEQLMGGDETLGRSFWGYIKFEVPMGM